ncbi:MAG TPA: asparagine synthase (glutamine-hydrolyzing) [Micropepsaceae bacterium]|nr:asparagine synthase (glutamine-hydrolyzing) [Micropepsaceae bacterium]
MCGIAGLMSTDAAQPNPALLDGFVRALSHRGPDGEGRYEVPGVGLVQTRLAIIDLSTGDQPLFGENGTALVANGEIYNYLELKPALSGFPFKTHSDCEVPLAAYARDGADFAQTLRGMYAIALHDARDRALYLARDPFGIKPLYYAEYSGGIVFASELQAILKSRLLAPRIRTSTATELVQLQFTTGRETIFEGIHRVAPGETLILRGGHIVGRRQKQALPQGAPLRIGETEALKVLDAALMDSVAVHQRSDVPYGMFLSGGIDSAAVLACMARLNEKPVRAFTAGFPATAAHDEREGARRIAQSVGAEHVEISVSERDLWSHLPAIAAAMDDPAADYAVLPTYMLAAEAAKELKVVLTGEGGDELFAGYGRYRSALRSPFLGGRPMRRRGFLEGLDVLRDSSRQWRSGIAAAERRLSIGTYTRLQQAQALDCADWLPNDLLLKVDRCLMAHGLEGRTPLLDPIVADFAFRLPDGLKIEKGRGKYLLRRWLQDALPASDPFAEKRGFTVPVGEWIQPHAARLAAPVSCSSGIAEICHPEKVGALFHAFGARGGKHEAIACWQLLFYGLWHAIHVERRPVVDDVFAMLERT